MDNRDLPPNWSGPDNLPPTAWQAQPIRTDVETSELTIAELIALVRETGGTVGGYGLWDPRHEDEVRRMLTTALEMEGVLPPGSVARLRR
jgi:hypothetical protein